MSYAEKLAAIFVGLAFTPVVFGLWAWVIFWIKDELDRRSK